MTNIVIFIWDLLKDMIAATLGGLAHSWLTLVFAVLTVSVLRAYIVPEKLKHQLMRKPKVSIVGSTLFGAITPLCAGGTLGLIVGLLTTVMPWGPIMAFLTSSPLMSIDGFIMVTGVIDLPFAVALAVASIIIGLGSGYITHVIETRTGFLDKQTRFAAENSPVISDCGCSGSKIAVSRKSQAEQEEISECAQVASECSCQILRGSEEISGCTQFDMTCTCGIEEKTLEGSECASEIYECGTSAKQHKFFNIKFIRMIKKVKWYEIGMNIINIGLKNMLIWFSLFMAVGYLVNRFIPTDIIVGLLGNENLGAVPIAALIGLPLYITTEASIPLIKAFMEQGASGGAMLAFWITGQATSFWIIAGLASFMKRRAIFLYIIYILAGGLIAGYLYNFALYIL